MSTLVMTASRGSIFEIILNRPEKRNALSFEACKLIDAAVSVAAKTPGVRCIVLRGEGKSFSAGIDISAFMQLKETYGEQWIHRGRLIAADMQAILNRLERLEIPTIALLHGHCVGLGLELALACDFRIASVECRLGLPETLLGLVPDVGGTTRLTRLIGTARAKELIFTGRQIDAETADRLGMLTQVVPTGSLEAAADALALELSRAAPLAIGMAKRIIDGLHDNERGYQLEGWAQTQLYSTEDFNEAIRSFTEKRQVHFKGQ